VGSLPVQAAAFIIAELLALYYGYLLDDFLVKHYGTAAAAAFSTKARTMAYGCLAIAVAWQTVGVATVLSALAVSGGALEQLLTVFGVALCLLSAAFSAALHWLLAARSAVCAATRQSARVLRRLLHLVDRLLLPLTGDGPDGGGGGGNGVRGGGAAAAAATAAAAAA
jgi:hypothetical protein